MGWQHPCPVLPHPFLKASRDRGQQATHVQKGKIVVQEMSHVETRQRSLLQAIPACQRVAHWNPHLPSVFSGSWDKELMEE